MNRELIERIDALLDWNYRTRNPYATKLFEECKQALALPKIAPSSNVLLKQRVNRVPRKGLGSNELTEVEIPKQEPQHHIVDSNKMINYVPMTDDELAEVSERAETEAFRIGSYVAETGYETMKAVEVEAIRRMKEQGLV